jgi:hypothetical protein
MMAGVDSLYEMDRCSLCRRSCFDSHIFRGCVRGLHMVLARQQLMWTDRRAWRIYRSPVLFFSRTRQMEMTNMADNSKALKRKWPSRPLGRGAIGRPISLLHLCTTDSALTIEVQT